jgi:hypothetical protein
MGVTLFAVVMNAFIEIVITIKNQGSDNSNEKLLNKWFALIRSIRCQPFGEGTDIKVELKTQIEDHFDYFWKNDRTAVLVGQREYFDSIPFKIQDHLLVKFLYNDIYTKPSF